MGAEAVGVEIPIGFTLDEAQNALRVLETMARRSGRSIQESAERDIGGLGGFMRKFSQEQRSEARVARYFVGEILSVVPASAQAKTALMGVGQAMVSGFGIGGALGLVTMGLQLWSQHSQEAEAKAKALTKALVDQEEMWSRIRVASAEGLAAIGKSPATWIDEQVKAATAEVDAAVKTKRDELRKLNAELAVELRSKDRDNDRVAELISQQTALEGVIADLNAEKKAEEGVARAKATTAAQQKLETDAAVTYYTQMRALRDQFNAQVKTLRRDAATIGIIDEREKIRAQLAQQIQDLRAYGVDEADVRAAIALARRIAEDKIRQLDFRDAKAANDAKRAEEDRAAQEEADQLDRISEAKRQRQRDETEEILAIVAEQERRRQAIQQQAWADMQRMGASAFRSFSASAVGELGKVISSSRAYERALAAAGGTAADTGDLSAAAFAAMAQSAIAALAQEAAVEAVMETARGLAAVARYDYASAGEHFASAAMFGGVALLAGGTAYLIGQNRGMTAAERAQVEAARQSNSAAGGASGAREVGGSGGGRNTNTRDTIIVIGDPFETPAETARRAARRIAEAKRLDMLSRADA
jgi:hypothetical protein